MTAGLAQTGTPSSFGSATRLPSVHSSALLMRRLSKPIIVIFIISAAIIFLVFCIGAYLIWDNSRFVRDFDSVVFVGDRGICSVQPDVDRPPYCPHVFVHAPAFSPDGQYIAASLPLGAKKSEPPYTRLVLMNRTGRIIRPLKDSEDFYAPVWTPDGLTIFSVSLSMNISGEIGRWAMPSGNRAMLPIRGINFFNQDKDCQRGVEFSLSPSGKQAVLNCDYLAAHILDIGEDALTARRMLPLSFSRVGSLNWIDDSNILFIATIEPRRPGALWKINLTSNAIQPVPTAPGLEFRGSLTLSPNRRFAAATARPRGADGHAWSIWTIELASGQSKKLTSGREDMGPSWGQ